MSKFEVGDRVKYKKEEYVIVGIKQANWSFYRQYKLKKVNNDGWISPIGKDEIEMVELAKPKQFTKADLKPNHIVEDGTGNIDLWRDIHIDYDNDLKWKHHDNKEYDIIKVYEFETLVWERKEEIEIITDEEIEEKLGKKIKIVEEKEND